MPAKRHALRHGEETLPGAISLSSGSSGGSSGGSCSYFSGAADGGKLRRGRGRDDCPVTGRASNVLDDYIVFPTPLGAGGYGCVRECIHRATWQAFACKSVDKSKIDRLDHLRNEVRLLSNLNHRGIVRMVGCFEDADYVHIVSEKYTGGELFDVIVGNTNEDGCLSERAAARIIESLLEAVAYLHDRGIVHRDIKPENILFQSPEEETLKLIDFGLSRRLSRGASCVGNPLGTSYYMSPEVLGGRYDESCDLWAVGAIAYVLLCGYPPFNGDDDAGVFEAVREGDLKFHARQWHSKGDDAKEFIEGLLRRDPRKRLTAREALRHPWIRNLGRKRERRRVERMQPRRLRYLKIP